MKTEKNSEKCDFFDIYFEIEAFSNVA